MTFKDYPKTFFTDKPDAGKKLRTGTGLVLQQEGLVNDLSVLINRHRRDKEYNVSDYIVLHLAVSPEVWWAIHFNESELFRKTLSTGIVFYEQLTAEQEAEFTAVELGDKDNVFPVLLNSIKHSGPVDIIF